MRCAPIADGADRDEHDARDEQPRRGPERSTRKKSTSAVVTLTSCGQAVTVERGDRSSAPATSCRRRPACMARRGGALAPSQPFGAQAPLRRSQRPPRPSPRDAAVGPVAERGRTAAVAVAAVAVPDRSLAAVPVDGRRAHHRDVVVHDDVRSARRLRLRLAARARRSAPAALTERDDLGETTARRRGRFGSDRLDHLGHLHELARASAAARRPRRPRALRRRRAQLVAAAARTPAQSAERGGETDEDFACPTSLDRVPPGTILSSR